MILGLPIAAGAQSYNRDYDDRYQDRSDRSDWRDVRDALSRLDSASARLESALSSRNRRVFSLSWARDDNALWEVRDFHRAVRDFWNASNGGRNLRNSYDQARVVLEQERGWIATSDSVTTIGSMLTWL